MSTYLIILLISSIFNLTVKFDLRCDDLCLAAYIENKPFANFPSDSITFNTRQNFEMTLDYIENFSLIVYNTYGHVGIDGIIDFDYFTVGTDIHDMYLWEFGSPGEDCYQKTIFIDNHYRTADNVALTNCTYHFNVCKNTLITFTRASSKKYYISDFINLEFSKRRDLITYFVPVNINVGHFYFPSDGFSNNKRRVEDSDHFLYLTDYDNPHTDIISLDFIDHSGNIAMKCKITFMVCHPTCEKCNPITNFCEKCQNGYSFQNTIYRTDCTLTSSLADPYHQHLSINNLYVNCYETCDQCSTKGDSNFHFCIQCTTSYPYHTYVATPDGKISLNCLTSCAPPFKYKIDHECFEECPAYKPYIEGNECKESCSPSLVLNVETKECVPSCFLSSMKGYNLNNICVKKCPINKVHLFKYDDNYCEDNCPSPLVEYVIDNKRYCKLEGCQLDQFYFYNGLYSCKDITPCPFYYIEQINQCVLRCPPPFIYLSGKVCQLSCDPLTVIGANNECGSHCNDYEIKATQECVSECPLDMFIVEEIDRNIRFCVDDCKSMSYQYSIKDNRHCVHQCESPFDYIIEKDSLCVSSCPEIMTKVGNKCVLDISLFEDKTLDSSHQLIKDNIIELLSIEETIIGKDFIAQLYTTDSVPKGKEGVSYIDISKCETVLRRENNIQEEDDLIVIKYDKVNSSALFNQVEYEILTKEGSNLNLSVCDFVNISYPINYNHNLDIDIVKAEEDSRKGIDIFGSGDDIFNDICSFYSNISDKNVVITDRRKYIYQNVTLCEKNCIYRGINYTSKLILCDCKPKLYVNPFSSENNDIQYYHKEFSKLFSFNIIITKCFNIFMISSNWKYNIGFWFMFCVLIFEIVSFVCFFLFNQEYFYSQFNIELKNSPPPTQHNMKLINYFITTANDTIDTGGEKRSMVSMIKTNKVNTNSHKNLSYIYNSIFAKKTNDIDCYPYYTALMYDKRTFLSILWKIFKERELLLSTIFVKSKYEIVSFNLCIYLLFLSFLFTCNGLWYTEVTIKGHSGHYQFNFHSIFALMFSWMIYRAILGFVYYASFFHSCIEEINYESIQGYYISKIISNIVTKIFVFFCISFLISLFVLYYLTIFCTLFNRVQVFCFVDCIISLVIGLMVSVVYSLLFSSLKTIAIRHRIKSLYNVVLYMKNIL